MTARPIDRRSLLARGAGLIGATLLAGCDRFAGTATGQRALKTGEDANLFVQRLLLAKTELAPEYSEADISPWFKPNGTSDPKDKAYRALAKANFATFRLEIDGLVERPQNLSLADLRALPARTQITRHDCVEGWSCIGRWRGVPLSALLERVGLKPSARYIVFHCADTMEGGADESNEAASDDPAAEGASSKNPQMAKDSRTQQKPGAPPPQSGQGGAKGDSGDGQSGGSEPDQGSGDEDDDDGDDDQEDNGAGGSQPVRYYETIDLADAFHPQTILAYEMNGQALPVAHGAPLRLRVERQLGYKMAKYVMRLEVVDDFSKIADGKGRLLGRPRLRMVRGDLTHSRLGRITSGRRLGRFSPTHPAPSFRGGAAGSEHELARLVHSRERMA